MMNGRFWFVAVVVLFWSGAVLAVSPKTTNVGKVSKTSKPGTSKALPANAIASVNGEALLLKTFAARWRGFLMSRRVPLHMHNDMKLKKRFLNHMLNGLLLAQEAKRQGIKVTNYELFGFLRRVRFFLNRKGQLDLNRVRMIVKRYYGLTMKQYLEQLRRDSLAARVRKQYFKKINLKPGESKAAFLRENTQLRVQWLALDSKKVNWKAAPTKAQINALLSKAQKALKVWYGKNTHLYQRKEQIRVRHIMLSVRGKSDASERQRLEAIRQKAIAKPSLFAVLAKQNTTALDKHKGGDLGWFTRGEMVVPFEKAAFAMTKPNSISGIVKTRFGLHIIQFLGRKPGSNQPFTDKKVQLDVASRLWRERQIAALVKVTAGAWLNSLRNGTTWDVLSKRIATAQKAAPSTQPSSRPSSRPSVLSSALKGAVSSGTTEFFGRNARVFLQSSFTSALVKKVFALSAKKPYLSAPLELGSRLVVVRYFKDRNPGEKGWQKVGQRWTPMYLRNKRQKALNTWLKTLRKTYNVQVNLALLKGK